MTPVGRIVSEGQLRDVVGSPTSLVASKVADRLNDLTRRFIECSPFVCVATSDPGGGLDVSPRGDPPGFVRVIDERSRRVNRGSELDRGLSSCCTRE